jgi:hypothetical protein
MKLTQVPSLRLEDFPAEQSYLGKVFNILNPFIQAVGQVINNNIDFNSNIQSLTRTYSINTFQSFGIQWPFANTTPSDLRIIQATNGPQQIPTVLLAAWTYNINLSAITVTDLFEVTAGGIVPALGQYQFTLRVTI